MDFDFSSDQKLFKQQVRRALEAACPVREVRRVLETDAPYSPDAWSALRRLGAPAAAIPAEYGGVGAGYYDLCVAAEEVGRALAPTPFETSIFLVAEVLLAVGLETQKRAWLPGLAAGEVIAAFCEGDASRRPAYVGGRLQGAARPVFDASSADMAIVLADDGPELSLLLVKLPQAGVTRTRLESVDPSRDVAEMTFEGVAAERVGPPGSAVATLSRVRDRAAILTAFAQVGGAERCLEMARSYALDRKAFGRPIASYQAIKHKLAEIYIQLEIARAHAFYGAWALDTNAPDLALAAAAARVSATEAFSFAAQENIHVHGGMGFTWEADCHLYYRRARLLAMQLGPVLEWQARLVAELERAAPVQI